MSIMKDLDKLQKSIFGVSFDDYVYSVKHAKFDRNKFGDKIPKIETMRLLKKCKTYKEAEKYLDECKEYPLDELYIQCEFNDGRSLLEGYSKGVKNE